MTLSDWAEELLDTVRRRFSVIVKIAILGCFASFLWALSQTHTFTSVAVLQVQGAKVTDELAPSVPGIRAGARQLQTVEQRIMAFDPLLEFGEELGLLADLPGLTESEQVLALREAVSISGVAAARQQAGEDGAISLIRISATWEDRAKAQNIAHEVAQRTIDLSRDLKLERASETLAFFSLREENLRTQLSEVEQRIASFRRENSIPEPGARDVQDREIEILKTQLISVEREVILLQGQIDRRTQQGNLSRVEEQRLAEDIEALAELSEQRNFLSESIEIATTSAQRDPATLVQLAKLDRDLEAVQEDLRVAGENRKSAEIAYQLEMQGQSERLLMLEEASWPDYPSTPSRTKMALLGAFVGVLVALVIAVLLDMKTPVVRSSALMKRELGFAPVVTVPSAPKSAPRRWLAKLPWIRRS